MSVTFEINESRGERTYPDCPECGANLRNPSDGRECSRFDCMGYGLDAVSTGPELNVANGNVSAVLAMVGAYGVDPFWGELDPQEVLLGLAVSESVDRSNELTEEPSEEQGERYVLSHEGIALEKTCRVINAGRSLAQVERYAETMREIAEEAIRRGTNIRYG